MNTTKKYTGILLAAIMVFSVFAMGVTMVSAAPEGAPGTAEDPETKTTTGAGQDEAQGGYIAELNLSVLQQTDKWQGYYGNVSSEITLDDATSNTMYDWGALGAPTGEVYATTNSSVPTWGDFNDTAATLADVNTAYSFESAATDDAADTFTVTSNTAFHLAGNSIAANFGPAVDTYGNTEGDGAWETVILYDGAGTTTTDFLFAGIISNDGLSFKSQGATTDPCDYQMIVPENPTDAGATTTYYFYLEVT